MRIQYFTIALALAAGLAMGQKAKSNKEIQAVNAVFQAATPDAKIAAVDDLLTKYKDTEFKSIALTEAARAEMQKGDGITALTYGNRAMEADPKYYEALLLVAGLLVQGTHEFDLDKDEKLTHATKLVNDAIPAINAALKPNPQVTDDQWNGFKKDKIAEAHDRLGMIAALQKKYDVAVTEFKASIDGAGTPDFTTSVRLASVYDDQGKFDDGAALLDKVMASSAPDAIKRVAQAEKQRAEKLKAQKK
ncbi:MAG TPA: hypothetical protein VGR73_04525 [Bryobacteraceae bacterium]|nr:hypothetical protein [Bryobacteraceae bacterium]